MRFSDKGLFFYDRFEEQAQKTVEGCHLLLALLREPDPAGLQSHARAIAELEHECDLITHAVVAKLHKTLITPLDRDEIYQLITRQDDVIDLIEAASERFALYEMCGATTEALALANVLLTSTERVHQAMRGFRDLSRPQAMLDTCAEIKRLENEADTLLRHALAGLFRNGRDAIEIMKWKEIYEFLETATDRCEDVANAIEGVVLENS